MSMMPPMFGFRRLFNLSLTASVLATFTNTDYGFVSTEKTSSASGNMVAAAAASPAVPTAVPTAATAGPAAAAPGLTAFPTAGDAGPAAAAPVQRIWIVVVGDHMSGLRLNWQLTEVYGAQLIIRTTTGAGRYRLHAFDNFPPGLIEDVSGEQIYCEIWEMDADRFGSFVNHMVRPPLMLGRIHVHGFSLLGFKIDEFWVEDQKLQGRDITKFGGWRGYLKAKKRETEQRKAEAEAKAAAETAAEKPKVDMVVEGAFRL